MEDKGVGKALQRVERLSALLDPRRKMLDDEQVGNGSAALRTAAEADLKEFIARFTAQSQPATATATPVPAPVVNVEPGAPATKKPKLSRIEERRVSRVAAAVGSCSGTVEPQATVTGRHVLIEREVLMYLAEPA
ncbi:unnamed protein product, partial [Ectocarpus sp. 4 AP-2014]